MASAKPLRLIEVRYEAAAQEYLRNLPPEHFMESIGQSTQREITLESLALVKAQRRDFHVFSELLVQWERPGERRPGQVCPDNMVVLSNKPIRASSSPNLPLEPARPYWMLEYVSKSNKRKDYDDNFDKSEKELQVPYYLIFYPENQELSLYHLRHKKYASVKENRHGRYPIRPLEIEVAILDGWVRFWYKGELLPLPAELLRDLVDTRRQLLELRRQLDAEAAARRALEEQIAEIRAALAQEQSRRANGSRGNSR
jgi:Uma2 family endonuclease